MGSEVAGSLTGAVGLHRVKPTPQIDHFLSRLASASANGPVYAAEEADVRRIVLLDQPVGNIVGRLQESGRHNGEFCVFPGGEVRFRYGGEGNQWLYVNRGLSEFRAAARLFNAFSWSAYDPDDPECSYFDELASRLRSELEKIEPLGEPGTSLWSATVHNTEAGLWTLY